MSLCGMAYWTEYISGHMFWNSTVWVIWWNFMNSRKIFWSALTGLTVNGQLFNAIWHLTVIKLQMVNGPKLFGAVSGIGWFISVIYWSLHEKFMRQEIFFTHREWLTGFPKSLPDDVSEGIHHQPRARQTFGDVTSPVAFQDLVVEPFPVVWEEVWVIPVKKKKRKRNCLKKKKKK